MTPQEVEAALAEAKRVLKRADFRTAFELAKRILEAQPEHPQATYLAAGAAMELGNMQDAANLFERVLQLAPNHSTAHAYAARCYLALHQRSLAYRHAKLGAQSSDPQACMTASVVLSRCGDYPLALQGFESLAGGALAKHPDLHQNMATVLKFLGRFEESEAAYEQAIALRADHAEAHAGLAELPTKKPERRIQRLQRIIAGQPGEDAELHYALARDLERVQRYDEAMHAFTISATARQKRHPYDFTQDERLFAATAAMCSQAHQTGASHRRKPIFVMGMPRTGTTLVERILSGHSRVDTAGELNFVPLFAKQLSGDKNPHAVNAEVLKKQLALPLDEFARRYLEATEPFYANSRHLVDKLPINFFFLPLLRAAFPEAPLIVLRRNPLDTVLSNFRQLFATDSVHQYYTNNLMDCARYVAAFNDLLDTVAHNEHLNVHIVDYEYLVQKPLIAIDELLKACGLELEAGCIAVQESPLPLATASAYQARQPISTASVDRWRHYESALEEVRSFLAHRGLLENL